ncbi:MAG: hypothetical protein E7391_03615 [Ruminococcaceae bacterium]|nr:hypothetical protein [Oscillospiraceae bacterium]
MKLDKTVKKETMYILCSVVILSLIMQGIFLILSKWDYTVLLGNLLGGGATVLNFLFMGITVQKAVLCTPDRAKSMIKISQMYRTLFMAVVLIIGVAFKCFNNWAVIIPVFFTRIAVGIRPIIDKNKKS